MRLMEWAQSEELRIRVGPRQRVTHEKSCFEAFLELNLEPGTGVSMLMIVESIGHYRGVSGEGDTQSSAIQDLLKQVRGRLLKAQRWEWEEKWFIQVPADLEADADERDVSYDPYELNMFLRAQENVYRCALSEIKTGRKRSHWMWYIFPQFEGLGRSSASNLYAIKSIAEAKMYLSHPILGPRLVECAKAFLDVEGLSASEILGSPDDLKLRSCATLFAQVTPTGSVFERLLKKYFRGDPDGKTLRLLGL